MEVWGTQKEYKFEKPSFKLGYPLKKENANMFLPLWPSSG